MRPHAAWPKSNEQSSAAFNQYADAMRQSHHDAGAMFDMGSKTPAEAFKDIFGTDREVSPEPISGILDKMDEPRKVGNETAKQQDDASARDLESEIADAALDIISELYDEVPVTRTKQSEEIDDALNDLAEIFGDDIRLKSVVADPPAFDTGKYNASKALFEQIVNAFGDLSGDVKADLRSIITALKNDHGLSKEGVVKLVPYLSRYLSDKYLPQDTNGGINKKEEGNVTNRRNSERDGQSGDEGEGPADVRGAGREQNTGRSGSSSGGGRNRNDGSNAERSDNRNRSTDGRSSDDGKDSKSDGTRESSEANGDRSSDGVSGRENQPRRDYLAPVGSLTREGSWRKAAENNLDAIELAKKIEAEGRTATPEEQAILIKFVGWGASELANNIFNDPDGHRIKEEWKPLARRLREVLTPEEIETARRSTQ